MLKDKINRQDWKTYLKYLKSISVWVMIIFSNGQSIFGNLLRSSRSQNLFLISYMAHYLCQFESKKKQPNKIPPQFVLLVITYHDKEIFNFVELFRISFEI